MLKKRRRKRGRPRVGHDEMVGVRLPRKLIKAVDKYAEGHGCTRSAVLRKAVQGLFDPPWQQALRRDLRDIKTKVQLDADEQALKRGEGSTEMNEAIARVLASKGMSK